MAAAGQLGSIVTVAGACTAAKWSAGHAILGCVSRKLRMLAGLRGRLAVLLSHPQEPAPFVQASVDRQAEPMRVWASKAPGARAGTVLDEVRNECIVSFESEMKGRRFERETF